MVLRGDSSMACLLLNFSMNETIHIHIYIPCWWVGKCVYKPRLHLNDNFENHGGGFWLGPKTRVLRCECWCGIDNGPSKAPSLRGLRAWPLTFFQFVFSFFPFLFLLCFKPSFSFGCLRAKEFYTWRTKAQKALETAGATKTTTGLYDSQASSSLENEAGRIAGKSEDGAQDRRPKIEEHRAGEKGSRRVMNVTKSE